MATNPHYRDSYTEGSAHSNWPWIMRLAGLLVVGALIALWFEPLINRH